MQNRVFYCIICLQLKVFLYNSSCFLYCLSSFHKHCVRRYQTFNRYQCDDAACVGMKEKAHLRQKIQFIHYPELHLIQLFYFWIINKRCIDNKSLPNTHALCVVVRSPLVWQILSLQLYSECNSGRQFLYFPYPSENIIT